MNAAPDKILFFSDQDAPPTEPENDTKLDHWRAYFPTPAYQVDVSADAKFAIESLQNHRYDVIILDDGLFGEAIYVAVVQLTQLKLLIPILVLTGNDSLTYQTNLMEAGAEDILLTTQSPEYLQRRLNLCLKRNEHNREVMQRNQKLYETTRLTQYLHTNAEPQTLIEETLRVVCGTFGLYGAAAVLLERGNLRVYNSQEVKLDQEIEIVQTLRDADPNAPFTRVIRTGVTEMFDDITRDKYYLPLPFLAQARGAIIMPLRYQAEIIGALVLFGSADTPVSVDDLGIYEIVTTQFALALQNASFNRMQSLNIQNGRILLNAWQSFLRVQAAEEVAESLSQHIEQLGIVDQVVVWINNDEQARTASVFARMAQAKTTFSDVLAKGTIAGLFEGLAQGPQVVLPLGLTPDDPLLPLFRALRARQLIFLPLADSARLIGGVLLSLSSDRQMSLEDANILKSLSHAAGQALERMMLIEAMTEKSDRLEAILRSITEGIFFVDDDGLIAYCNPQIMELTNVSPSEILGERPEVLLNLLAEQAVGEDKARLQFYSAINSIQGFTGTERHYPIVELTLKKSEQQIHVEFVVMGRQPAGSWIGLVWTSARGSRNEAPSEAVDLLLHTLHATGAQLRMLVGRVPEMHSLIEQQRVITEIDQAGDHFQHLLEQYAKLYNLNFSEPAWNSEAIELGQLVEDLIREYQQGIVDGIPFAIEAQLPEDLFYIEMDRSYVKRGLQQLLENLTRRLPRYAPGKITVRIDARDDEIRLIVSAPVVNPYDVTESDDVALWKEISAMNRCRFWTETDANNALVVTIAFPRRQVTSGRAIAPAPEVSAPLRAPEAVMLIQGRSAITKTLSSLLEREGFHLYTYGSGEEAVQDVTLTRLDLIVVDGNLPDEDSLEICKQLRRRTEVPVVMVATRATNLERVEALRAGVDDYITEPISNEELLAKISVLFKRQHLADRTEEPLDLGDLRIDFARRAVFVNHKPVLLTRIEYDLLRTLAVNMGQVLTHQQLLEKVWGPEYRSETQYLWVNISRLRKKLEPSQYIHNQQGIGYMFQAL